MARSSLSEVSLAIAPSDLLILAASEILRRRRSRAQPAVVDAAELRAEIAALLERGDPPRADRRDLAQPRHRQPVTRSLIAYDH
jgi:hypothetical protein